MSCRFRDFYLTQVRPSKFDPYITSPVKASSPIVAAQYFTKLIYDGFSEVSPARLPKTKINNHSLILVLANQKGQELFFSCNRNLNDPNAPIESKNIVIKQFQGQSYGKSLSPLG